LAPPPAAPHRNGIPPAGKRQQSRCSSPTSSSSQNPIRSLEGPGRTARLAARPAGRKPAGSSPPYRDRRPHPYSKEAMVERSRPPHRGPGPGADTGLQTIQVGRHRQRSQKASTHRGRANARHCALRPAPVSLTHRAPGCGAPTRPPVRRRHAVVARALSARDLPRRFNCWCGRAPSWRRAMANPSRTARDHADPLSKVPV